MEWQIAVGTGIAIAGLAGIVVRVALFAVTERRLAVQPQERPEQAPPARRWAA